jgi:hypothetical protein
MNQELQITNNDLFKTTETLTRTTNKAIAWKTPPFSGLDQSENSP